MTDSHERERAAVTDSYLKISSPSFSLELEGHPSFIMQSYDMVREDVLRRLMELMRQAAPVSPSSAQAQAEPQRGEIETNQPSAWSAQVVADEKALTSVDLQLPAEVTGRPSGNFRATSPVSSRPNNMRDIKARMASKQPVSRPSTMNPQQPVQSAALNTQASIQVDIPPPPGAVPSVAAAGANADASSGAAQPVAQSERAQRAHYIWIYITHQAYNKVYVADIHALEKSPVGAFMDGRRVRKIHLENVALAAFRPLFGEGQTMWSEPNPARAKGVKPSIPDK